jgi:hypothetical protein
MNHESTLALQSQSIEGVKFTIARMSFGRRLELARRIRDVSHRLEFVQAGNTPQDTIDAALINGEVDRICLAWGLIAVEGLEIDGRPAEVTALIEKGPEELTREILTAIKRECGLNDEERKN